MIDASQLPLERVAAADVILVAKQLGHRSQEVMDDWYAKAVSQRLIMFAVFDGDAAVASINILLDGADEQPVLAEIGLVPMLNALGVNEPYRRRGQAVRLIAACEEYLREHPEPEQVLALGVEPENSGARALYEKLGYQYHSVAGQELFESSWPEYDTQGKRFIFSTQCLLMVKQL